MKEMYAALGVSAQVYEFGEQILRKLQDRFARIDQVSEYNQAKVLHAMQENKISAACFAATTGYGYDDLGRERLEKVYADTFHTEAALVRPQITCGTHALAVALSANLLPGDELLSPADGPYDTLEEVIGIRESKCSLKEYGVTYAQADLKSDGSFDYDAIRSKINERTKLVTIQRSKGYATRPTLSVDRIGELIAFVKNIKPDVIALMNGAVKLAAYNSNTCEYLKQLEDYGVKILISDSCADRMGISEAVGAGVMVDMVNILEEIFVCEKVINI